MWIFYIENYLVAVAELSSPSITAHFLFKTYLKSYGRFNGFDGANVFQAQRKLNLKTSNNKIRAFLES